MIDAILEAWNWLIELPGIDETGVIVILLGIVQAIVNLTPTEKDNDIFRWIKKNIFDWIPNLKKSGGVHSGDESAEEKYYNNSGL